MPRGRRGLSSNEEVDLISLMHLCLDERQLEGEVPKQRPRMDTDKKPVRSTAESTVCEKSHVLGQASAHDRARGLQHLCDSGKLSPIPAWAAETYLASLGPPSDPRIGSRQPSSLPS